MQQIFVSSIMSKFFRYWKARGTTRRNCVTFDRIEQIAWGEGHRNGKKQFI